MSKANSRRTCEYFASHALYDSYSKVAFELVGQSERVLDVGCGTGRLAERLRKEKNCYVVGVEVDDAMAAHARERCDELLKIDIELPELPLQEDSFDAVVFSDSLEHLKRPDLVLLNLRRYLGSRGRLILVVPNIAHLRVRLGLLLGKFDYEETGFLDKTHLRFFTLRTLRKLVEHSGYRIVRITTGTYGEGALHVPMNALAKAWKTLLAGHFVIVAIKS